MSEVVFIFVSGLLLAVPVGIKYLLAFQTRALVQALKRQERQVQFLVAQLQATEQECRVVGRAVRTVVLQRRNADDRRTSMSERLDYVRRLTALVDAENSTAASDRR